MLPVANPRCPADAEVDEIARMLFAPRRKVEGESVSNAVDRCETTRGFLPWKFRRNCRLSVRPGKAGLMEREVAMPP